MFQTKVVEKSKTHIFVFTFFFSENRAVYNVEEYCRNEQATDDNMAHAHCMLDTQGYKRTLSICNTHCFALEKWLPGRT